ncbi:MAG: hypothetical protein P8Z37_18385 [Acidobacteriota bacterium]
MKVRSLRLHEVVKTGVDTRRATEDPADVLYSTSRSLRVSTRQFCNAELTDAADMPVYATAVEVS